MSEMERPAALGALTGRVDIGMLSSSDSRQDRPVAQPPNGSVTVIRKNALEEIRVGLSEYNGHDLINIRVWADPRNGGTERIPTKAGIACNVRLLPDLIEALREAEAQARAGGLL
jgi:hypothetical protein